MLGLTQSGKITSGEGAPMAGSMKKFITIFRQNLSKEQEARNRQARFLKAQAADDRRLRGEYAAYGQRAVEDHLREFRYWLYRDLSQAERDALGLLVDVEPDLSRPFGFMNLWGTKYELRLFPERVASKYGVLVWAISTTNGRRTRTDYAFTGLLCHRLRELFEEQTPAAVSCLE